MCSLLLKYELLYCSTRSHIGARGCRVSIAIHYYGAVASTGKNTVVVEPRSGENSARGEKRRERRLHARGGDALGNTLAFRC